MAAQRKKPAKAAGQLRIIGGQWRSRVLRFPADGPARPTGDRVRETLFNWLTPWLPGARCIDLYAGTGALGFEALSRGAAEAVLIERDPDLLAALQANAAALQADGARVIGGDARAQLAAAGVADIIFIDPPFVPGAAQAALAGLPPHLAPQHRVYLERSTDDDTDLPPGWTAVKSGRAGRVRYDLLVFDLTAQGSA